MEEVSVEEPLNPEIIKKWKKIDRYRNKRLFMVRQGVPQRLETLLGLKEG